MSTSVSYAGNKTFGHPNSGKRRSFFHLKMTGGNTSTIEFGDGGGTLAIAADGEYNATEGMNTKINIVSAGTYIVHTDDHE